VIASAASRADTGLDIAETLNPYHSFARQKRAIAGLPLGILVEAIVRQLNVRASEAGDERKHGKEMTARL